MRHEGELGLLEARELPVVRQRQARVVEQERVEVLLIIPEEREMTKDPTEN